MDRIIVPFPVPMVLPVESERFPSCVAPVAATFTVCERIFEVLFTVTVWTLLITLESLSAVRIFEPPDAACMYTLPIPSIDTFPEESILPTSPYFDI